MGSSYGENLKLSIFGASHADSIGMTLESIPAGLPVDIAQLQAFLQRRAPGQNPWSTPRKESDIPEFTTGLQDGMTSGEPITAVIYNQNTRSKDYGNVLTCPRPGHADYTSFVKYGEIFPGGGHFSGRMTAPLCIAGGMCLQWLEAKSIRIGAHILKIGTAEDAAFDPMNPRLDQVEPTFPVLSKQAADEMQAQIASAKAEGDSLGGWIECAVTGLPAGIGGPMFDGVESRLAEIIYGIPAVKELAFGDTKDIGSENNDAFTVENGVVKTVTNHCGGILGGITNSMPLIFRVRIKPTPSIAKPQQTVDLQTKEVTTIQVKGRHDPCIVPRAVPVVEAATAIALFDMILGMAKVESMYGLRQQIDQIDDQIVELFQKRMAVSEKIGAYKKEHHLPVFVPNREEEKLNAVATLAGSELAEETWELYETILRLSKLKQSRDRFGLLGEKLEHSYSPAIHKQLGNYAYDLYEQQPDQLEDFLLGGGFQGINVTIPYKKAVIPYCDELTPQAKAVGAVNTIVRKADGSLLGHNTDYFGFETMVKYSGLAVAGKKVLVLGSGGASNTVVAVLQAMGAMPVVISRQGENNYENLQLHADAAVIVNATPVGMYPNTDAAPVDIAIFPKLEGVLDLIYNPARTMLLQAAEERGLVAMNGLLMLVAQAKEAGQWFTGAEISDDKIVAIYQQLRQQMENIVLIGMPGCGKSTVGKLLAEKTGKTFVDADALIPELAGKSIQQIFAEDGEEVFREWETKVLSTLGKKSGMVIATGGGCVTRPENEAILRQNGRIFCLERQLDALSNEGRPLSQQVGVEELYRVRKPLYAQFADYSIDNNGAPAEAMANILKIWEEM